MNNERQKLALAEAYMLADTGRYYDYTDIEYVLRFGYGLSDVGALFDQQITRLSINRRCADARGRAGVIRSGGKAPRGTGSAFMPFI